MAAMRNWLRETVNRRHLLWGSLATASGSLLGGVAATGQSPHAGHGAAARPYETNSTNPHGAHGNMITVGDVGSARNGFDPTALLTDWDTGIVSLLPDGRTLRTFEMALSHQASKRSFWRRTSPT
ncbi:hypothetical protein [Microvirga sp. VF16]|uniref:hypothetical protein n=1 Tax=Microvirga sp. VF16 TaxID=2807101 RepID=UPI001FF02088|nr:hypothetical protein [Microvirga sp. VF16]